MLSHTTTGPGLDLRLLRAPSFSIMAAQDPKAQITLEMVCRLTNLSAASVYKRLREPSGFPAPCATNADGANVWIAGDVRSWMRAQAQIQASIKGEGNASRRRR